MKKWLVIALITGLCVALFVGGALAGTIIYKELIITATVTDEAENIDVFLDAECTIPATEISIGNIRRGDSYVHNLYAKNISETRRTRCLIEITGDVSWSAQGIMLAPNDFVLDPSESIEIQMGIIVPITAPLEDVEWGIRFYSDEDIVASLLIDMMPTIPDVEATIDMERWLEEVNG